MSEYRVKTEMETGFCLDSNQTWAVSLESVNFTPFKKIKKKKPEKILIKSYIK